MPKIQITARGIRAALKKFSPYQSIAEYIWNGFDANASEIKIDFFADEIGNITSFSIADNGYGIEHAKLQEKFEPMFESKKALENKLKQHLSALHGKNGIGRLTFFVFARNAVWQTTYAKGENNEIYEIFANAENINFYTGLNTTPKITNKPMGTKVTFSGIHSLTGFQLNEKFEEFLCKEFAWFLKLNEYREFSIIINGKKLDYSASIADTEDFQLVHEKTNTIFDITYVRWHERNSKETSKYYYIDSTGHEKWKEASSAKNRSESFHHSVFIRSSYFDSFSFQSNPALGQESIIGGTRADTQFRFMRRKISNFLRIKRRPFLKDFAQKMVEEYRAQGILSTDNSLLDQTIRTLYEMQPRFFLGLKSEQQRLLINLLDHLLNSTHKEFLPSMIGNIVDLSNEEHEELKKLLA